MTASGGLRILRGLGLHWQAILERLKLEDVAVPPPIQLSTPGAADVINLRSSNSLAQLRVRRGPPR